MKEITPQQLHDWLEQQVPLQLIDVREPEERERFHIGGELFPLTEIMEHTGNIRSDCPVVFYCKMGIRSQLAIQRISEKMGLKNLVNLKGGLEAWKKMLNKP